MVDNKSIICSNKSLRNETVSIMVNITNLQLKNPYMYRMHEHQNSTGQQHS